MSQYVVGVSGGIGSGKTTVTNLFLNLGVEVIDADVIAREVVESGTPALQAIVTKWGQTVINQNGSLNRTKLRELVFANDENKTWLNNLLHPIIRQEMQRQVRDAKSAYCILSIPLLVENKLSDMVNRILIVDVSEETQLQRTMLRDNSSAELILTIMRSQASREQRLAVADDVIENNAGPKELNEKVRQLHQHYLALSQIKII